MARKIRIQRKFSLTTPIDYRDLSGKKRHSGHPLERPARFDGNWRPPICAVPPFRPQAAIILQTSTERDAAYQAKNADRQAPSRPETMTPIKLVTTVNCFPSRRFPR